MPRRPWKVFPIALCATAMVVGDHASAQQVSCTFKRDKVVGGEPATIVNWPGQATLRLHSQSANVSKYFCGATAVAERWVLTAAHCISDFDADLAGTIMASDGRVLRAKVEIVVGTDNLTNTSDKQVFQITRVVMPKAYADAVAKAKQLPTPQERQDALDYMPQEIGNDLALLQLDRPWRDGKAAIVSLATETDLIGVTQVLIAGFGQTEANLYAGQARYPRSNGLGEFFAGSATLRQSTIKPIDQQACRQRYAGSVIGNGQLCAGLELGGKDSCQGDSGGPLVALDANGCARQIGIVSWGEGCAEQQSYGVYTRISNHADWIRDTIGGLQAATSRELPKRDVLSADALALSLKQLDSLLAPVRGRVTLGIGDARRIKIGSKLVFTATSQVAGRLAILDIDANRKVTLLFPNEHTIKDGISDNVGRIDRGATIRIPDANYGFTNFTAQPPAGKGNLIALVAPDDFDFRRFIAPPAIVTKSVGTPAPAPQNYLMDIIRQIDVARRDTANTSQGVAAPSAIDGWAYDILDYEFVH